MMLVQFSGSPLPGKVLTLWRLSTLCAAAVLVAMAICAGFLWWLHLILSMGRSDSKSLPLLPLVTWRDIDQHIQLLFPSSILEQVTRRAFLEPVVVLLAATGTALASWQPLGPWAAGLIAVLGLMVVNMLCVKLGCSSSTIWIDTE